MNIKTLLIGLTVALAAIGAYLVFTRATNTVNESGGSSATTAIVTTETYSSVSLGFEFTYPIGEEGLFLQEMPLADPNPNALANIALFAEQDRQWLENPPQGGEGPPSITIRVFKNAKKQLPTQWAIENTQYSNYSLMIGEVSEYVLGGANAVRYKADGLYASDTVVVAHGENLYVFIGMYMDENTPLRTNFEPLLQSVRFIPSPGQE